ncbi:septum site-determining protein MinC [Legionella jordanis]|uniref:septum site-determining protein MinC n=1 Tax=Legionella jordanis TaxID=456 RepID=UPI000EFE31C3|nr:septum site-determining protein MinC [Legionella jordanis]RMX18269.1 septum site-determining protein MinC [Legionella jordanis]HAT8713293.1 septum site-determining protein MinC [Legionella jordanis]
MVDNLLKSQAFKLKGRLYTFTVLQLLSSDGQLFANQLTEIIRKAPKLFDRTPIVLDFGCLESEQIDLQFLCQCLREHNLVPVGVQNATPLLTTLAQCQGLAILHASATHDKSLLEEQVETAAAEPIKTKLLTTPVRSGQQVVSKGGDLIITASVSHGAELLADGNIHIYGTLRGRALAGISGDQQARIFCQALEAELVSIAGFYRLSDAIEPHAGPCQIYLQDEHIHIEPIC